MPAISEGRSGPLSLTMAFGAAAAAPYARLAQRGLRLPLPCLGRERSEEIFPGARARGEIAGVALFTAGDLLLGYAVQPVAGDWEASARELYGRLFRATAGASLCRIWNYVPEINRRHRGLENYRAFSAGRARAFAADFGAEFKRALPAGSAVGCGGDALGLVFIASRRPARTFENPEQIPAYRYPRVHGPRSPSFSRAAAVEGGGRKLVFISGTAAIKGHRTVAPRDLAAQLDCTLDNLRLISRAAGMGDDLGAGSGGARQFKIYLRRPADLAGVRSRLRKSLLRPGDAVVWLQADLCRAALLVEIEATLLGPRRRA